MSKLTTVICAWCGNETEKTLGHVNRAKKENRLLFCNKVCFGLHRRVEKSKEQKKQEKRLYDMQYRKKNAGMLKAKKAAYFQRSYDPVEAAKKRQETMPRHVEYCRRPEYKAYKSKYDSQYRAKKMYGEFYESFLLLLQIDREVESRASKYEIGLANGTINKAQSRRRNHERTHRSKS